MINVINNTKKICELLSSTVFKLWRPITGNEINNYDFFKVQISARGDHCDCPHWAPKKKTYARHRMDRTLCKSRKI